MSDDALPPREEVLDEIRSGRRDVFDDAYRVRRVDGECIEVHHEASDGDVVVHLSLDVAWLVDESGGGRMVDL